MKLGRKGILALCCLALASCGAGSFLSAGLAPRLADVVDEASPSSPESPREEMRVIAPRLAEVGDCTLISYQGHHALIDAGGGDKSSEQIYELLKKEVPEGTLDYLFFTHSDSDHILGFTTVTNGVSRWLNEGHKVKNFIDFDSAQDPTVEDHNILKILLDDKTNYAYVDEEGKLHSMANLTAYRRTRGILRASKKIENYFTASQLHYKQRGIEATKVLQAKNLAGKTADDLKTEFVLGEGKDAPVLTLLYNRFEANCVIDENKTPSSEGIINNLSLCLGVTYADKKALFTGDLEEYITQGNKGRIYGESDLIKNNKAFFDRPFDLLKAGHHGSLTSSSPEFLALVRPKHVLIETVGNDGRFNFPRELPVLNYLDYTDMVAVTSVSKKIESNPVEGSVQYVFPKDGDIEANSVDLSGNATPLESCLTNSFLADYRKARFKIYNLQTDNDIHGGDTNCTYVKVGSHDVVIGLGTEAPAASENEGERLLRKIEYLCNDGVLDYLILPSQFNSGSKFLTNMVKSVKGGKIKRIGRIIYSKYAKGGANKAVLDELSSFPESSVDNTIGIGSEELHYDLLSGKESASPSRFGLSILCNSKNAKDAAPTEDKGVNSLLTRISFAGKDSYVHLGSRNDYGVDAGGDANDLLQNNPTLKSNVALLQMPANGMLSNRGATEEDSGTDALAAEVDKAISKFASNKGLTLLCQGTFGRENNLGSEGVTTVKSVLRDEGARDCYFTHREKPGKPGTAISANEGGTGDIVAVVTLNELTNKSPLEYRVAIRYAKKHEDQDKGFLRFEDNSNYLKLKQSEKEPDSKKQYVDAYLATKVDLSWLNSKSQS